MSLRGDHSKKLFLRFDHYQFILLFIFEDFYLWNYMSTMLQAHLEENETKTAINTSHLSQRDPFKHPKVETRTMIFVVLLVILDIITLYYSTVFSPVIEYLIT